jgi:RNA polymerase sigma factor FliA
MNRSSNAVQQQEFIEERFNQEQGLIEEYVPYAKSLVRDFLKRKGWAINDIGDFESHAYIGLCEAARRFDRSKNVQFKTFCYLRIRGALIDYLRSEGTLSRADYAQYMSDDEGSEKHIGNARNAHSLSSMINAQEDFPIQLHFDAENDDMQMSYAHQETVTNMIEQKESARLIRLAIHSLPKFDAQVISLRYHKGMQLEEIGKKLGGFSKSYISRVHIRAIQQLREIFLSYQ